VAKCSDYYDADILNALYGTAFTTPVVRNDPRGLELQFVNDVADLLVGDAMGTLTGLGPRPGWAPFPNGYITLDYNTTIMAGAGEMSVDHLADVVENSGGFILVVEGTTPLKANGQYCWVFDDHNNVLGLGAGHKVTMLESLEWMVRGMGFSGLDQKRSNLVAVVNIGTCASFGGIPGSSEDYGKKPNKNPTGAVSTEEALASLGISTKHPDAADPYHNPTGTILMVNTPGCPPNPDWFYFNVVSLWLHVLGILPITNFAAYYDYDLRPRAIYAEPVCTSGCQKALLGIATELGQDKCMQELGCKGYYVRSSCARYQWNNFDDGTLNNYCVGNAETMQAQGTGDARHPCQGCVERNFPDWPNGFYGPNKI
jgi:Ni,Fe-hydrogenase I small subunit